MYYVRVSMKNVLMDKPEANIQSLFVHFCKRITVIDSVLNEEISSETVLNNVRSMPEDR